MIPISNCSILLFRLDITMNDLSLNLEDVDVDSLLAEDADYTTSPSVLSSQRIKRASKLHGSVSISRS